jgi:TRAF3-interacting protein 1
MNTGASQEEDSAQSAPKSRPARPSSARPAPPKPKKNDVITEDPVVAGRKVPNVIVDKKGNSDDDDDDEKQDFLGKDDDADETAVHAASKSKHSNEVDADGDGDHGGLVKKILETKKELEAQPTPGKKTQIDRSQVLSDATRRKERDVAQHEIDRLRSSVQTLTRSVNPLGKILDFLQEDLDAMQKEMAVWHQENKDNMVALHREQSVTESLVEPLKAQLAELDSAIRDQLDLIAAVKSTILHNDLKISKMLGAVTKS